MMKSLFHATYLGLFELMLTLAVAILLGGCASLENKAVAIGSGIDAFKLETTGSVSSGTVLPNIIAGGAVNTLATAPVLKTGDVMPIVFVRTRRNSFFGELFGVDATTESLSYIGAPGESAGETAARFKAFAELDKPRNDKDNTKEPGAE